MSGQPLINPTDRDKFREQYLANLNLQASIDDMNLQANKVFKRTGQTPSQLTDYSTTAEKLANIERVKIDVRQGLSKIADGQQAQSIVEQLSPDEIIFLAQQMDTISKDIQPKYKYGVLANIFVPYLRAYIAKHNETNGVEYGLQQSSGREILLSNQQILRNMIGLNDLKMVRAQIQHSQALMGEQIYQAIQNDLRELVDILPTEDTLRGIAMIQNANVQMLVREELNDALQNLPNRAEIIQLLRSIDDAGQRRDANQTRILAERLHQELAQDPAIIEELMNIRGMLTEALAEQSGKVGGIPEEHQDVVEAKAELPTAENIEKQQLRTKYKSPAALNGYTRAQLQDYIKTMTTGNRFLPEDRNSVLKLYRILNPAGTKGSAKQFNLQELNDIAVELDKDLRSTLGITGSGIISVGRMTGKGLSKPKRNHHIKDIDYSKGIQKVNKYVPLGRWFINQHKLNDDIIAVRRASGGNITGFPSERITKNLGMVVRKIVNGGSLSYDDIHNLDENEKRYLHKLTDATQINDRLKVPAPSKTDDDKDIHQFEVMKGEIMSGNDSKELVKNFKILIMKLSNKGLLPKSQAKDLLIDLVSIGY